MNTSSVAGDLIELGKALETTPDATLRGLAPPFLLVWGDEKAHVTRVQIDGLGQAQLFEYDDGQVWALTNRIAALRSLDVELQPVPEQWAVRMGLGWFPMNMAGFRSLKTVLPGTGYRIDRSGVRRNRYDVLKNWVTPQRLPEAECLDYALDSAKRWVRAASRIWDTPTLGMSGGWDSRAVAALLRGLNIPFSARTRGFPDRPDVIIAFRLADIAGVDIRLKTRPSLPPDNVDELRTRIICALEWQAGHMLSHKHKTYKPGRKKSGGVVNLMGQYGEVAKTRYMQKVSHETLFRDGPDAAFIEYYTKLIPPFIRPNMIALIIDTLHATCRQADGYDCAGLHRLNFHYLYEGTRRNVGGSVSSQTDLAISPYLAPGFINAAFSMDPIRLRDFPIHHHIIDTCAPDWRTVPTNKQLSKADLVVAAAELQKRFPDLAAVQSTWQHTVKNQEFDEHQYWEIVGRPLIDEASQEPGFWTEIFEPSDIPTGWRAAPDDIAIAHLLPQAIAA